MSFSLEDLKKATNYNSLSKNGSNNGLAILKSNLSITKTDLDDRINSLAAQALPQAAVTLKESRAELVFIFDRSGSCMGTEKATIQGFNGLIEREKRLGYPTNVSTILFDSTDEVIHDYLNIDKVMGLNYCAEGGTALYDTLCKNLSRIKQRQIASGNDAPNKTVVVIMTDGADEHSKRYDERDVRKIVSECISFGWEFIFLGANINAKKVASSLGINPRNAENYSVSGQGILTNFQAVSKALESIREEGMINPNWSVPIRNQLAIEAKNYENDMVLKIGGRK